MYRKAKARDLFDQIMQSTYNHAEPGVVFIDRVNQELRKATLDRDRGLREKVMSLEAAARLVGDGDRLRLEGAVGEDVRVDARAVDELLDDARSCQRLEVGAKLLVVACADGHAGMVGEPSGRFHRRRPRSFSSTDTRSSIARSMR